jgi:hypothetical protein
MCNVVDGSGASVSITKTNVVNQTEIGDAVWDEVLAAHTTADTAGLVLNMLTQDAVDLTSPSVDINTASIFGQLLDSGGDWAFDRSDDSLRAISESGGGGPTAEQIADQVWDEVLGGHTTADTPGLVLNMLTQDSVDLTSPSVAINTASIFGQLLDSGGDWAFDRSDDSLRAISESQGDVVSLNGSTQSLTDLKDFADDGYNPATNKITGVLVADLVSALGPSAITDSQLDATAINEIASGVWKEDIVAVHSTADTAGLILSQLTHRKLGTDWITDITSNSVLDQMASKDNTQTYARADDSLQAISESGGGGPTAEQIADQVWDEVLGGHTTADTPGLVLNMLTQDSVDLTSPSVAINTASIFGQLLDSGGDWALSRADDSLRAISESGGGGPTAEQIADAVWDENIVAAHGTANTSGLILSQLTHRKTATPDWGTDITSNSVLDQLASKDNEQTYSRTTDALEAARDNHPTNFDLLSITAGGGVKLQNSVTHGGAAAVLQLERLIITSDTLNQPAIIATGSGSGAGLELVGGQTGDGIIATGGAGGGDGMELVGQGAGVDLNANVTATAIGAGAIDAAAFAADAITSAAIAADAITASHFQDDAIAANVIATDAIGADAIAAGAIEANAFANDAITSAAIAADAITASHFQDGAITSDVIATDAIDADAIADNAIDAGVFADDAITSAAIAPDAITASHFQDAAITSDVLADAAIQAAKIGASAIQSTKIAADTFQAYQFQDGAITSAALADDVITGTHLAASAYAAISDEIWDEDIVAAHGTSDTAGLILSQLTQRDADLVGPAVDIHTGSILGRMMHSGGAWTWAQADDSLQAISEGAAGGGATAQEVWEYGITGMTSNTSAGTHLLNIWSKAQDLKFGPNSNVQANVITIASNATAATNLSATYTDRDIIYVSKQGNDSNAGTGWGDAFLTVGAALTAAASGSVEKILIGPGTFTEAAFDADALTDMVIEGSGISTQLVASSGSHCLLVGHRATVRHLKLSTDSKTDGAFDALRVINVDDVRVEDCWIQGSQFGINNTGGERMQVRNCHVGTGITGISLTGGVKGILIENCTIETDSTNAAASTARGVERKRDRGHQGLHHPRNQE